MICDCIFLSGPTALSSSSCIPRPLAAITQATTQPLTYSRLALSRSLSLLSSSSRSPPLVSSRGFSARASLLSPPSPPWADRREYEGEGQSCGHRLRILYIYTCTHRIDVSRVLNDVERDNVVAEQRERHTRTHSRGEGRKIDCISSRCAGKCGSNFAFCFLASIRHISVLTRNLLP